MALTVKRIAKLTEPDRYGDGRGLYLQVTPADASAYGCCAMSAPRKRLLRIGRNGLRVEN